MRKRTSLLALTHKLDGMFRSGTVKDFAELARLGQIPTKACTKPSRAR
jgi:hypothetical protein